MIKKLKEDKYKYFSLYLLFSILIASVLYRKFLLFNTTYIYLDVGADTAFGYWPCYTYIINSIKSGHFAFWSFNIGIGTSTLSLSSFIFDPFNIFLFLVPIKYLSFSFGYLAVIKNVTAGLIFFIYLRKIKVNYKACLLGSLMWSFNGYLILWGQHYNFATMIVLFTFIILGAEIWYQEGKGIVFCLSIALMALNYPYFMFSSSIYTYFYCMVRYIVDNKIRVKAILKYNFRFFAMYFLGIGMAAFIFIPVCMLILKNPRINQGVPSIPTIYDIRYYVDLAGRLFSNNISQYGVATNWQYYELPMLSSSILAIFMALRLPAYLKSKGKKVYTLCIATLVVSLVLPIFGYCFNLLAVNNGRWTFGLDFMIVLGASLALSYEYESAKIKTDIFSSFVLIGIIVFQFAIIILNIRLNGLNYFYEIQKIIFILIILLLFYNFIIRLNQVNNIKFNRLAYFTLVIILAIELTYNNNATINHRTFLKPNEALNIQYYNEDYKIINSLKNNDKEFFRIDKSYNTFGYNDALFQDYMGIKAFNSLNNYSYLEYLKTTKLYENSNFIGIFKDRFLVRSLLGVKYFLNKEGNLVNDASLKLIKVQDGVEVYENLFALPMSFAYENKIDKELFNRLSREEKDEIVFNGFTTDDKTINSYGLATSDDLGSSKIYKEIDLKKTIFKTIDMDMNKTDDKNISIFTRGNDPQLILRLPNKTESSLRVSFDMEATINIPGKVYWRAENEEFSEAKSLPMLYKKGSGYYDFYLDEKGVQEVRIDLDVSNVKSVVKNLSVENKVNSANMSILKPKIEYLRDNKLDIKEFNNNKVKGNISLQKPEMLFLSIPFDKGWKAKVDGKSVNILNINNGFIGIELSEGTHLVELDYTQEGLYIGIFVSVVSFGLLYILRRKKWC